MISNYILMAIPKQNLMGFIAIYNIPPSIQHFHTIRSSLK